ncbi:MAG: RNA polymerase sigma factor [Bacteroidetes bacterium]|nr:MAG: RNA polymerase sigma factor [Bacteroidota bacterium]
MDNLNVYIHAPLIEECRKGNRKAQFRLYNQYSKAMYNLAYRMLNNREDAEDIVQEAFVECFRNLSSFRFESTFGAWLKKILINKSINQIKKKKIDLTLTDNLPNVIHEEEDEVIYDTGKIFKGIEMLPNGYRIILTLYLLEGYDHSEISEILDISESTSKSQYSRAKEKLRNILSTN